MELLSSTACVLVLPWLPVFFFFLFKLFFPLIKLKDIIEKDNEENGYPQISFEGENVCVYIYLLRKMQR